MAHRSLLAALMLTALPLAGAQSTPRTPVGTTEGLLGPKPIYARCSSPASGKKALAGLITVPRGVEPACGRKEVRAHVEWAWGGPPSAVAIHGYWVGDDRPLRDIERQLRAAGWKLDGRWPSASGEQVRYARAGQEVTLQYDTPFTFDLPGYKRTGRMLQMQLLRH